MGTFIDNQTITQFSTRNGKINLYHSGITVPVYVFSPGILFENEYFSLITDREAEGIMPYYAISNYGRVWHIYKESFMSPGRDRGGYIVFVLQHKTRGPVSYRAHRLIMLKYRYFPGCEDISRFEVNHIDGDKTHNVIDSPFEPDNLEWTTRRENVLHAFNTGLMVDPEDKHKYTDEQIHLVCQLLQNTTLNHNAIAAETGVSYGTIAQIKRRKQWTNISKDYNF